MSRKSGVGDKSPALSSESSLSSVQQEWDELELEAVETVSTIRRTETISPPITRRKAKGTQKRTAPDDSGSRKKVKHSKAAVLSYQEDTGLPDESTQTSTSKKRRSQGKTRVNGNNAQDISVEIEEELVEVETVAEGNASTKKQKNKKLSKVKGASQTSREGEEQGEKPKRRRKTKEEKEAEAMPLAARTVGLRMYIGAHRRWKSPALDPEHTTLFKSFCRDHKYDSTSHILPHGSYLVNLAQNDHEKAKQAYDCFLDDLRRCEELGIKLYNFHPGWTGPHPRCESIARIAAALNRAHRETSTVKTVLETMVSQKTIGSRLEDLRDIIALVDDKSRVGVCLDTCHVFAAGYDLRTLPAFNHTLAQFDQIIGLKYLSALHLNDSKAPFSAARDLHQNIGLGFLGLRAFHNIMNDARLEGLPMVLETPIDRDGKEDKRIWAEEIKLLESLIGMDPESMAFRAKEKELADQGVQERNQYQAAFDKKVEKELKAAEKKRRKERVTTDEEESEESAPSDGDGL